MMNTTKTTTTNFMTPVAVNTEKMERLSKHFTLSEMTRSGVAISRGWDNTPDALAVTNLQLLCEHVLEPLRRRFGVIRITSAFRTRQLNNAVGGVENSQHVYGQAADIFVVNQEVGKKMFMFLKENVEFDQLIYEYRKKTGQQWIHVSYDILGNRRQAFMNYDLAKR